MADAATIGASMSQYTGNAALGGGGLGAVRIDVRPIEDFAKYVFLYNKAEWDQRQRDLEKDAEELASFASLDLSTTIPKHAKILQDKYDSLYGWVRENPDALKYRTDDGKVNTKYIEYRKRKADLMNDISFAKKNSILNEARKKQIADEPNEQIKSFLQRKLDSEIEAKDIRETLDHSPKYDLTLPDWGQNKGQSLEVMVRGANDNTFKKSVVFDINEGNRLANAYAVGLAGIDPTTETGVQQFALLNRNPLVQGANILNTAIANAMQGIDQTKTEAEQTEELKKKLSGLGIMKSVNQFNDYMTGMRAAIRLGRFNDEFGPRLNADDYKDINIRDGISPEELSLLAQFAGWEGDKTALDQVQTNNEIERKRLAAEWARIGIARDQIDKSSMEDLISATSAIREAADVLASGRPIQLKWQGGMKTVREISDPNLLKEFGTIEKDGTVTKVPDAVYYDESANKISLIYYKRDDDNKIQIGTNGAKELDRDAVDLTATQWLGQIVRRKNPNSDIGGVNSLIEKFFNSPGVGRRLSNLKLIYWQTAEGTGKKTETESSTTTNPSGGSGITWR